MESITLLVLFSVFIMFVFIFLLFTLPSKGHNFINSPNYNDNDYNIPASCSR